MAQSRWFSMADDRNRNEELPSGKTDDDAIGRISDEDDEEFDDTEDLDEEEEDVEESER